MGSEAAAKEADDVGGSRSLRRALDILELMLERGETLSVADIVARLKIPKSTAYELVRTLGDGGYVERSGKAGGLFLGRKLFELGMAYRSKIDLLKDGSQIVEELRDQVGETVQLSVMENDMMLVLVKEEGSQPIRIISRIGSRVPVNWAAAGRLLVSDLDDAALRELLQRTSRPSPTGHAVVDIDKLVAQVRRFRKQGYGIEINEANEHAGCIAAPVLDASGRCVAAISAVAPEQRLARPNRDRLIAAVCDAARRLSQRLGHA
jgi:IclR family transcriptional regulator, KDG regulon repressor